MRGQVYEIDGVKIFSFGGARSHDIRDGILDPKDPNFEQDYFNLQRRFGMFRVLGVSWWPQEMPNEKEMEEGLENLKKHGHKVDFIITHDCPSSITTSLLRYRTPQIDELNRYFDKLRETVDYKHWYFGHYHGDKPISDKETLLYHDIKRIH